MQTIDAKLASAINRLHSNSDFQAYMAWVADSLAKADADNRRMEGAPLHRSQGRAQVLEELLNAQKTAQQALTRANARG